MSAAGLRTDGRRPKEIRRIRCRLGLFARVDGSAYFEQGNTKVIAVVYGPREVRSSRRRSRRSSRGVGNRRYLAFGGGITVFLCCAAAPLAALRDDASAAAVVPGYLAHSQTQIRSKAQHDRATVNCEYRLVGRRAASGVSPLPPPLSVCLACVGTVDQHGAV